MATQEDEPVELYVNAVRVNINPYDLLMEMGAVGPGPGQPEVHMRALVRMSPQHALAFSRHLSLALEQYQAAFGPITLPEKYLNATMASED